MAPTAVCLAAPACAVVSLAAPPHQVKGSGAPEGAGCLRGTRCVLAKHAEDACEASLRPLRSGRLASRRSTAAFVASTIADNAREAGYKPEPQETAPGSAQRDCLRKTPLR